MAQQPPRRADARRNYDRLLSAAESALNEHGAKASLDDIATAAGVGNATLYRHFPTRELLIEAVYDRRIRELCEAAPREAAGQDPGAALFGWLRAVAEHITGSRMLGEAFLATHHGPDGGEPPQIAAWHRAIHAATEPLLAAAQEAGAIRADLDATELMTLTAAIARAGAPADSGRFMGVLYEGLVPRV